MNTACSSITCVDRAYIVVVTTESGVDAKTRVRCTGILCTFRTVGAIFRCVDTSGVRFTRIDRAQIGDPIDVIGAVFGRVTTTQRGFFTYVNGTFVIVVACADVFTADLGVA